MKRILLPALLCCCSGVYAQNLIDNYLTGTPTYTVIANSSNSISQPRDLDFKPFTNELWIANRGSSNGGSMVLIFNAGEANQTTQYRMDSHSGHFFIYPSAIAFGDDGEWGNTNEIKNTASPTSTFMGPALWTGDTSIFARVFQNNWEPGKPLGSHLDMLHQSPFCMGIAHDSASAYWVFDGHNGNLCKYDFGEDHSPGYDDHSNGKVWRYTDVALSRVVNVPGHMIKDKSTGWLYIIDAGTKKLKRVNTTTGSVSGNLTVPSSGGEALAGYWAVTGATVETLDSFLTSQPCGVDVYNGRLIVSDNANGDIHVYDITGITPVKLGVINTGQAGIMGVKIGADGRIWFVNYTQSTVVRINPANTLNDDAAVIAITAPVVNNFEPHFYHPGFNECSATITPAVTIKNTGANTLTTATINYSIDNSVVYTYLWTGSLAAGATANVTLQSGNVASGAHKLSVDIANPNGGTDPNPANNIVAGSFRVLNPVTGFPLTENFSAATFPPSGWTYLGHNFHNEMTHVANVGFGTNNGSVKMDNYFGVDDIEGQKDMLMTPRIDFTNASANVNVSFAVAYAQYDNASADGLRINVSTDCGDTWTNIYSKSGAALITTSMPNQNAFTPAATEWKTESVSLSAYMGQPEIIVQFMTVSDFGNNLFLDNISISNTLDVGDHENMPELSVYPNPATDAVTVKGLDKISEEVVIAVYDMVGKMVHMTKHAKGIAQATVDLSAFSTGNYILKVTGSEFSYQQKIAVIR